MTARLHTLRHQEKKSSGNGQHRHHHHHQQHQQQQQQQQQQQIPRQGASPAPSPSPSPIPSPKHSDGRRANKPLMEKRRRARINQSLAALKALILDSARLENTKHSKLEKADILELTVRHLQRQRSLAQPGLSRYKAGYQDCSREVSRYLDAPDIITGNTSPIEPAVKQRLIRHLDSCVSELDLDLGSRPDSGLGSSPGSVIDRVPSAASPTSLDHHLTTPAPGVLPHCSSTTVNPGLIKSEIPEIMEATAIIARPDSSTITGDENNNGSRPNSAFGQINSSAIDRAIDPSPHNPTAAHNLALLDQASTSTQNPNMLSVVQVIPSRLPDGQVVFLLPSHYVQLAAAAAANGISIGPNPPTAIWAATNMSLLKATDKLVKRSHCNDDDDDDDDNIAADVQDWTSNGTKPTKSPRIELADQPLDFTTTPKKIQRSNSPVSEQQRLSIGNSDIEKTMLIHEKSSSHDNTQPAHHIVNVISCEATTDSVLSQQQSVKEEEGMWRPW